MLTNPSFQKLNEGWNADPNTPEHVAIPSGLDLVLRFALNPFQFTRFDVKDEGMLRFVHCSRYRLGATNDEGWYRGECRYSELAPGWGEFYELTGYDPLLMAPLDWKAINPAATAARHFLFYFRDATFECIAADWAFEPTPANALFRHFQSG